MALVVPHSRYTSHFPTHTNAYTHMINPQTDTSIIRDKEIANGDASACGRTLAGGVNDMAAQMEAASSAGLPAAAADGTVSMTIHQVNGDGAG